ncbi:hypothetical protein [uncultured Clostridium sp.]|uniref:hypothetical protein n=1 Tax=uncultured Clostridium sp. TaxID=59620 RepID=UPI0026347F6C|nr:hypothetical protein [uncultured Clostridium sp.]
MGVSKFSKKIYKGENNNNPFIMTVIVIVMIMYNAINTYYNEDVYKLVDTGIREIIRIEGYVRKMDLLPETSLKMNLFSIISAACLLIIFSATIYIREKGKKVSCMFYSGRSYSDALIFLIYNSMKSFLWGIGIGGIGGILISPLYNILLYNLIGESGKIFTFYIEGIGILILYLLLVITISIVINWGFVYRKDTIGLMNLGAVKKVGDKRSIKIPWIIIVVLYMMPIITLILFANINGVQDIVGMFSYLSLGIIYWLITYSVSDMFKSLKKRDFMYRKNRIIYLGNAMKVIKESFAYMAIFLFMLIYTVNGVSEVIGEVGIKEALAISLIGIGICVSASLGYKLSVEFRHIKKRALQLSYIGFSDKQIIKCIKSEVIVTFLFTIFTPLIILMANLLAYVFQGDVTIRYALAVMISVDIPIIGIAIIIAVYYSRKIKWELIENKKQMQKC